MTDISHGSLPLPNYYPLFDSSASPADHPPIAAIWGALTGTLTDQTDLINYIANALAGIIANAPGALDTLKELADAIGDDANYAGTVTAALAARLLKTNNLSDLTSAVAARTNLGLGSAALLGAAAVVQVANNLSDLASVGTARSNLSVYSKAEVDAAIAAVGGTPPFEIIPTKPTISQFTLQNGGVATFANVAKGVALYQAVATGTGVVAVRFAKLNAYTGANAHFDVRFRFRSISPQQQGPDSKVNQIIMRNATSGKMIMFGQRNTGLAFGMDLFSSYTSGSQGANSWNINPEGWPWNRVTYDGATLTHWVSPDGETWGDLDSQAVTYISTVDEIGFGFVAANQSNTIGTVCQHVGLTIG